MCFVVVVVVVVVVCVYSGGGVAAHFVTAAHKFDALPARFFTPAHFVTTWGQNVPKGPLAARFVTPSPATL